MTRQHRNCRRRHRRPASRALSAEARRGRHPHHRPRAGGVSRHRGCSTPSRITMSRSRARTISASITGAIRRTIITTTIMSSIFRSRCSFRGDFTKPSRAVDYRIYLPALMQDFMRRGGKIEYRRIEEGDIQPLVARFDLLVVSTGKGPLGAALHLPAGAHALFAAAAAAVRRALHRRAAAGPDERHAVGVAGHGEMIVIPTITFDGIANALLMENVPGGDMEELATLSYDDNPQALPAGPAGQAREASSRRPTTASTPRASISRSRRICCRAAWCRRCATPWSNSTAANARSRSATCIRSSIR